MTDVTSTAELIMNAFADGLPHSRAELRAAGVTDAAASRALTQLLAAGQLTRPRRGVYQLVVVPVIEPKPSAKRATRSRTRSSPKVVPAPEAGPESIAKKPPLRRTARKSVSVKPPEVLAPLEAAQPPAEKPSVPARRRAPIRRPVPKRDPTPTPAPQPADVATEVPAAPDRTVLPDAPDGTVLPAAENSPVRRAVTPEPADAQAPTPRQRTAKSVPAPQPAVLGQVVRAAPMPRHNPRPIPAAASQGAAVAAPPVQVVARAVDVAPAKPTPAPAAVVPAEPAAALAPPIAEPEVIPQLPKPREADEAVQAAPARDEESESIPAEVSGQPVSDKEAKRARKEPARRSVAPKPNSLASYVALAAPLLWFVATGLALIFGGEVVGLMVAIVVALGLAAYYKLGSRKRRKIAAKSNSASPMDVLPQHDDLPLDARV